MLEEGPHPEVELRLDVERTLSGIAVDGEGRPLEGIHIRARTPQEDAPHWKREGRLSRRSSPGHTHGSGRPLSCSAT